MNQLIRRHIRCEYRRAGASFGDVAWIPLRTRQTRLGSQRKLEFEFELEFSFAKRAFPCRPGARIRRAFEVRCWIPIAPSGNEALQCSNLGACQRVENKAHKNLLAKAGQPWFVLL